ncbi:hypothetical protein GQ53DRAFT_756473 [Thozetella sp. PMI_491]|nr:hypothetical protein GQ53DRAFT_756473 [Thozetella sp. PMI_491]
MKRRSASSARGCRTALTSGRIVSIGPDRPMHAWYLMDSPLTRPGSRVREREDAEDGSKPYRVRRWRLDEETPASASPLSDKGWTGPKPEAQALAEQEATRSMVQLQGLCGATVAEALRRFQMAPSPLPDHLLSLVEFNVLNAFIANKMVLADSAAMFTEDGAAGRRELPFFVPMSQYPGRAVLLATARRLPTALEPTPLQTRVEHATWIDLIPFPRMRDNLIAWEAHYDHAQFISDMLGTLLDLSNFFRLPDAAALQTGGDDRSRLVIWGSPHRVDDWEVTPGFLRRWWWALEGCGDLIAASNRWRAQRGERPLAVALRGSLSSNHPARADDA